MFYMCLSLLTSRNDDSRNIATKNLDFKTLNNLLLVITLVAGIIYTQLLLCMHSLGRTFSCSSKLTIFLQYKNQQATLMIAL